MEAFNKYTYTSTVTIGDTNCTGNMYFHNFFKLQGIARELYVKDCIPGALEDFQQGLKLITKEADCQFIKDFYLYDPIQVELYISKMAHAYIICHFHFLNAATGDLHARGKQTLVFADAQHKICKIPPHWRTAIAPYLLPASQALEASAYELAGARAAL